MARVLKCNDVVHNRSRRPTERRAAAATLKHLAGLVGWGMGIYDQGKGPHGSSIECPIPKAIALSERYTPLCVHRVLTAVHSFLFTSAYRVWQDAAALAAEGGVETALFAALDAEGDVAAAGKWGGSERGWGTEARRGGEGTCWGYSYQRWDHSYHHCHSYAHLRPT